jgi:hypothetical protein
MILKMGQLPASSLSSEDLMVDLLHAEVDENTDFVATVGHNPNLVVIRELERCTAVQARHTRMSIVDDHMDQTARYQYKSSPRHRKFHFEDWSLGWDTL